MLVAIPVGHIADRTSRRKVFAFILAGILAALLWTLIVGKISTSSPLSDMLNLQVAHGGLSLRFVWGTSIFYLCGGGYYAAEMMISVMIATACSEQDR